MAHGAKGQQHEPEFWGVGRNIGHSISEHINGVRHIHIQQGLIELDHNGSIGF